MTQKQALQILKSGKNVFLTGEPGAGKTYTINLFAEFLETKWIHPSITASTGIAATHIDGMTIHSWSGLGITYGKVKPHVVQAIINKPYIKNRFLNAKVLIIDEVSMLDAQMIENVDIVLRAAKDPTKPFGGMQVIFVGDFFQLPPVSKVGEAIFAFEAQAWKDADLTVCYLTEQHRQEDDAYLEILTAMRNGALTREHIDKLKERRDMTKVGHQHITKLYTHNADVDGVNMEELRKIKGPERTFVMTEEGQPYVVEILKKSCISPEILKLKVGALVMFTRNNFDVGYVNGTIGEVTGFNQNSGNPIVRCKNGLVVNTERAEWSITRHDEKSAAIRQIPLRLAWAITVHKSQGMSLDAAIVDLSSAFEYGQGYVALSRVRSLDGLYLEGLNAHALKMHPKIVEQDKAFRLSPDGKLQ